MTSQTQVEMRKILEDLEPSEQLAILDEMVSELRIQDWTKEKIENRDYTFVFVLAKTPTGSSFQGFLVPSKIKEKALMQAEEYVIKHQIDIIPMNSDGKLYDLFPGNYINKARTLFEEGKYLV